MKKRMLIVMILVIGGNIFAAEQKSEKPISSKRFIVQQPGTTLLMFENSKNFTEWQEKQSLDSGSYCLRKGQLDFTVFGVAVNEQNNYEVLLQLSVKSAKSISLATQLLQWNGQEWIWNDPVFNGFAYEFDCEVPSSPIINLRRPSQDEEKTVFFGREHETQQIGFVTGGSVQDALIEFDEDNKTCHLVMPFKYVLDRSGRTNCSGQKKIALPKEATRPITPITPKTIFVRQRSLSSQGGGDMNSSIDSHDSFNDTHEE